MSLVDYASSDEEEREAAEDTHGEDGKETRQRSNSTSPLPSSPPLPQVVPATSAPTRVQVQSSSDRLTGNTSELATSPILKLPDASVLLNSPISVASQNMNNHSSRVAAAMAENASRKREANSLTPFTRGKVPKGSLPPSRNIPDTGGGKLVPPQLSGRSNIVTEDMNKLFVKRKT